MNGSDPKNNRSSWQKTLLIAYDNEHKHHVDKKPNLISDKKRIIIIGITSFMALIMLIIMILVVTGIIV